MAHTRSILVTGANQGLGRHTVHKLAATPNVIVFMGSRKISAAENALVEFKSDIHASSTVVPIQLDITDAASIKDAHAFIKDYLKSHNLPGLDVLVNNAARSAAGRVEDFQELYAVNVFGTVAITEAIRPLINNGGSILNISTELSSMKRYTKERSPPLIYPAYASSKAALNNLTVQWALREELKDSGIRVVSICPGFNKTNLNDYTGTGDPADGCMVIVKAALEKEGRTGVFFNKDGDMEW
ncbi:hypothetical protein C8J57DRAFT_1178256 [Mycena rebaudengoi]|nr:hypothetical protein C8J57DRAFT_1178256 [Mycena rebaudengoi]